MGVANAAAPDQKGIDATVYRTGHRRCGGRACVCVRRLPAPVARAVQRIRHVEWFRDHVRIASMLFDGAHGIDAARPGFGLAFKCADAERCAV